jgi:hypothetical protein
LFAFRRDVSVRSNRVLAICAAIGIPVVASAQTTVATLSFDHFLQQDGGTILTQLTPGEQFKIVVGHTCPAAFDYVLYKSPTIAPAPTPAAAGTAPHNPSATVTQGPVTHEAKWGSYILEVKVKDPAQHCDVWVNADGIPVDPPDAAMKDRNYSVGGKWVVDAPLKPANYVVAVETSDWEVGVDLGPVFALGTDKKYVAQASPIDGTKKIVAEDVPGESFSNVAIGTITHFYLPTRKLNVPMGPVAGFSILSTGTDKVTGNQTQYYIGWGAGLGPKRFRLNAAAGAAYAAVPTLPAGINVRDPIGDPAAIATLRNVYHWRFFMSFTGSAFKTGDDPKPPAPNAPKGK